MNGIGAGTNSLGPSRVSIHDRPDNTADAAIYRAQGSPQPATKTANSATRYTWTYQHNHVLHALDPGNLRENISATYVLAHSNEQDQQISNRAGVVFAPAPP